MTKVYTTIQGETIYRETMTMTQANLIKWLKILALLIGGAIAALSGKALIDGDDKPATPAPVPTASPTPTAK